MQAAHLGNGDYFAAVRRFKRRTRVIEAFGETAAGLQRTTTLAYDAADNLVQVTDPLGRVRRTDYDGLGQPTAVHLRRQRQPHAGRGLSEDV